MNNELERKKAINYIQNLSEKQFVDFFYEAVTNRNEDQLVPNGYEKDRICLIRTSFGAFENKEDKEHLSEFMALPTEEFSKIKWIQKMSNVTEQGRCKKCKAQVISVAKLAACPICDTEVECT